MHNELVVDEVERVALRLPRTRGIWHCKGHLKVERLDDHISEVVPLDHAEALHRVRSDVEGQLRANSLDIQEVRAEVVRDRPGRVVAVLLEDANVLWSLCDLEKNLSVVKIPDLEGDEVHLIDVGGIWAEEVIRSLR